MNQIYKKILFLFLILLGLSAWWLVKVNKNPAIPTPPPSPSPLPSGSAQIISTKPDPLDETIIPTSQVIEITFNKSLQNIPEFKVRIEPKVEFKVELSADRKTARIKPVKPFNLGSSYTLTINPDTKFDGVGEWGQTKDFHFRTITYKGV